MSVMRTIITSGGDDEENANFAPPASKFARVEFSRDLPYSEKENMNVLMPFGDSPGVNGRV